MADEVNENIFLVNAPAGSGKTTWIRQQVESYLLHNPKDNILCITYTNRAAEELGRDLEQSRGYFGTIHSFINDFIGSFFSHKEIIDLYWEVYETQIIERIRNIEQKKTWTESNERYREKYGSLDLDIVRSNINKISYNETPFNSLLYGGLGHNDLITFTKLAVDRFPIIKKKISDKYQLIFIDEYQDTSAEVLHIFYTSLVGKKSKLYLLGDKMQQIYKNYNGEFEEKLETFNRSVNLSINYRTTPKIVDILNYIYNDEVLKQCPYEKNSNDTMAFSPKVMIVSDVEKAISDFRKTYEDALSILLPWYPQTMADLEKRKNALKCLKTDNPRVFWSTLKKLLPNKTRSTSGNPRPKYLKLEIPEEVKVTNAEANECYVYLVELAVDTARNENEKLVELIDQLGYMYEPTLTDYLECLENCFEFGTDENTFEVWLKLRECMARIEPTEGKVIYKQIDRIRQLIEKMEPTDIRVKHREWYLGNRYLFDKGNYANRWKMLEDKKLSAVKEIFDEYGSEEVERFGCAVKNVHDVANKLGRFLRPNEMSSIIEKCFIGILSKEFTINCLISFVYTQGAEKLLETSLCQMEDEFMLEILSKIPFSLQLLDVINQVLDDDTAYWEKGAMPYSCYDAEELKIIVEKLVVCKRYVTAVNIIGDSECEAVINAECIYKLMKLAGTEESIGVETLDDYAVQKIIGWFQQQEDIDLELRSDIEFIYLPMLDEYSEVRPRALNTRLSLEPEYFCSLIELFYKERNGEKREIELNKSLSDRLYEILFQFKVIPGIDWNGNFDAKRFDYWMKTVKTWSRDNDRYEVAMHTVGSGLSYAELDEDKLPQTAIIEELNRVENEELRRGYYLGIINQRGVHWIDPEGKPELELAEDYENRANIAESRGYSRYAGVLRVVVDEFRREARRNALRARNENDDIE